MAKIHEYWVYMLQCRDGTYYTGVTNNPERRLWQHNTGQFQSCYTFKRRPVRLVYASEFKYILDAISWEKHLKKWSNAKKKALIEERYEALPALAKKDFSIRPALSAERCGATRSDTSVEI